MKLSPLLSTPRYLYHRGPFLRVRESTLAIRRKSVLFSPIRISLSDVSNPPPPSDFVTQMIFLCFLLSTFFFPFFTHHVQNKSGRPGELQGKEVSSYYCLSNYRTRCIQHMSVSFSSFFFHLSFFFIFDACRKAPNCSQCASVHSFCKNRSTDVSQRVNAPLVPSRR